MAAILLFGVRAQIQFGYGFLVREKLLFGYGIGVGWMRY